MKSSLWCLLVSLAMTATPLAAQPPGASLPAVSARGPLTPGVSAVTNVSVIPMTRDTVLRDHTVLIRNGRIAAIGPSASVRIPAGAAIVEGRGRFLIPGLADMHTHLFSDGSEVHDSAGLAELGVMLANGITTARLMIGTPEHLVLRRDVASGVIAGPQLWLAGPHLVGREMENGIVVTTPEEARAAVRRVKDAGYDFVKITLFITPPVYDAIMSEAKARGIRVVGHVDPDVGLDRALGTGQQLEHLDSYLEWVLADSAPMKVALTQQHVFPPVNWRSMDHVDDAKIARIAGRTARTNTWQDPTLHLFNVAFGTGETDAAIRNRADWGMWPPTTRNGYLGARERYWAANTRAERTPARLRKYVETRNKLVKAIQDSGGKLLAGSDTPEWFHTYGWGLHRELEAFVQAGLTPYQALVTATRNPAEFLGVSRQSGTIERGKRADLLLLDANPLDDIANTMRISSVALGGRWMDRREMERMIERGRNAIAPGQASLPSSAVLAQLPDGEMKRQFIIDCTNCHQMTPAHAYPGGKARTRDEWMQVVGRMASFSGPRTGFPIMSAQSERDTLAGWLAAYLRQLPGVDAPLSDGDVRVVRNARVREYLAPEARDLPHDVAVDSAGRVVVTGMFTHTMYVVDTASGTWQPVGIPVNNANPRAVEIAANGDWWVVLGGPNMLARYTPSSGAWKTWDARMYAHSAAIGADGKVWFNGHFTRDPEQIGYVDPRTDSVRFIDVPRHPTKATEPGGPIPYELRVAPSGVVWMSELQGHRMVSHDPRTGASRTYELPTTVSAPRRFDVDYTGALWIPTYAANSLVRFDPEANRMEEIPLPRKDAVPYVARAHRADIWVGTNASDEVYRYNSVEKRWYVYPLPTPGAVIRHLVIDPRNGDLWLAYGGSPGIAARVARLRTGTATR